ncbi:MAG: DNA repair protein RecO [Gammaproteobacteria bacterium]|nr:DNA repair protein RecO [Gammaproteobacteria bacterium]
MNPSAQRIELHPAYILHSKPYRDTSLLLEAFTRDHGRIGLVARGVRGNSGRRKMPLMAFRAYLMSWSGRGELATLSKWEPHGPPGKLSGSSLMSAYYINELMIRLTHRHDAHPVLFEYYREVLDCLSRHTLSEACLRYFELNLLDELGYAPDLGHEADSGEPVQAQASYCYLPEQGAMRAYGPCPGVRVGGKTLLELSERSLSDADSLKESKRLMRAVLQRYLGDRPLKTREIFRQSLNPSDRDQST